MVDIKFKGGTPSAETYDVKAGTAASIKAGQLVIVDGSNAGYVKLAPNGTSNTSTFVGLTATDSDETASADGTVQVYDVTGIRLVGQATTTGNLAQSVKLTSVTLDVTSGVQTIDENDTTNGVLVILDYDAGTGEVEFVISTDDTIKA